MVIRSKADIQKVLERFDEFAEWDGLKYCLATEDAENNGTITFMRYEDGTLTYHRKNELFWDIKEQPLEWNDLWKYRKVINSAIK